MCIVRLCVCVSTKTSGSLWRVCVCVHFCLWWKNIVIYITLYILIFFHFGIYLGNIHVLYIYIFLSFPPRYTYILCVRVCVRVAGPVVGNNATQIKANWRCLALNSPEMNYAPMPIIQYSKQPARFMGSTHNAPPNYWLSREDLSSSYIVAVVCVIQRKNNIICARACVCVCVCVVTGSTFVEEIYIYAYYTYV